MVDDLHGAPTGQRPADDLGSPPAGTAPGSCGVSRAPRSASRPGLSASRPAHGNSSTAMGRLRIHTPKRAGDIADRRIAACLPATPVAAGSDEQKPAAGALDSSRKPSLSAAADDRLLSSTSSGLRGASATDRPGQQPAARASARQISSHSVSRVFRTDRHDDRRVDEAARLAAGERRCQPILATRPLAAR